MKCITYTKTLVEKWIRNEQRAVEWLESKDKNGVMYVIRKTSTLHIIWRNMAPHQMSRSYRVERKSKDTASMCGMRREEHAVTCDWVHHSPHHWMAASRSRAPPECAAYLFGPQQPTSAAYLWTYVWTRIHTVDMYEHMHSRWMDVLTYVHIYTYSLTVDIRT